MESLFKIIGIIFEDNKEIFPTENHKFNDFFNIMSIKNIQIDRKSDDDILDIRKNMKSIDKRSSEWLKAAAHKTAPLLKLTLPLAVNSNKSIRIGMYNLCEHLILSCSKNLEDSIEYFLECLIILSEDEDEKLVNKSLALLDTLNSYRSFYELLLEKKLTNIFRIMKRNFSLEQEYEFKLCKGIFNILNRTNSIRSVLLLPGILDKFIYGMINAFELEINKDLLTNYEDGIISFEKSKRDKKLCWQKFKYINEVKHSDILFDVLRICGNSDVAELIFERLIEIQRTSDFKTEIFMIATVLVCESESTDLHELFLHTLLDSENFDLTTEMEPRRISEVSINIFNVYKS